MKEQMLQAAARIKSMASAYPNYDFSRVYSYAHNYGAGDTCFAFQATAHFGRHYVHAEADTLDQLFQVFNANLHLEFRQVLQPLVTA